MNIAMETDNRTLASRCSQQGYGMEPDEMGCMTHER